AIHHHINIFPAQRRDSRAPYLRRGQHLTAADLGWRAGQRKEPGSDCRRPGRARSQSAQADLGALGVVQHSDAHARLARRHRRRRAPAGYPAGQERLAADRLRWPVSTDRESPLLPQTVCARYRAAGFEVAHQGRTGSCDAGPHHQPHRTGRPLPAAAL
ncbi:Phospholipid-binding protein, YbhB/YbcL family, partial [Sideroxydans sp. CL21]